MVMKVCHQYQLASQFIATSCMENSYVEVFRWVSGASKESNKNFQDEVRKKGINKI